MGGYIQGGGHSPLTSLYGTGADQVLALEVVTADGEFVTASPDDNSDLFWALRGGGGSTFGVVTSITVRAHPDTVTTSSIWSFNTSKISNETFWAGVRTYFDYFISNADAGTYSYFTIAPPTITPGVFTFSMIPFFAPGKDKAATEALLGPWFSRLNALGITFNPNITEYSSYYTAWLNSFPLEVVEKVNVATMSRLFPRKNFEDPDLLNKTFNAIRASSEAMHFQVHFNIKAQGYQGDDNAVTPAWRDNILFSQQAVRWGINSTASQILSARHNFTYGVAQSWRDISPGAGSYLNEADRLEPDFGQAFWGDHYPKLQQLKTKWDPDDVFWAATAVGSERWQVETANRLPSENGKLCRKAN
jgi:hypothetical protein